MFKKTIIASMFALAFSSPAVSYASGAVAGATEITQIANNIELVTQVYQQAEQLANELTMIQNMVTNTQALPSQVFSQVFGSIQRLQGIVATGNALAFSAGNIDQMFRDKYTGYQPSTNYNQEYTTWYETTMDSIRGAMNAANLQSQDFATEESTLASLRAMSQSSIGQHQALQVGNQISVEQAAQMQKLRALMMSQMQAQNAYMAGEREQQAKDDAAAREFMKFRVRPGSGQRF